MVDIRLIPFKFLYQCLYTTCPAERGARSFLARSLLHGRIVTDDTARSEMLAGLRAVERATSVAEQRPMTAPALLYSVPL